jgi:cytidylate kinase
VILGRGAHLVLGQGEALRVLVVAPLEERVHAVMEREGLVEREARRRIVAIEADRKAFLMKHFHADFADTATFDIVVNTAVIGIEGACDAVKTAITRMPRRVASQDSLAR